MLSNCESNIVQIIQINLVLKNGAFDTPEKQFVQIIQINLVLKNKDRRSQILDEFK